MGNSDTYYFFVNVFSHSYTVPLIILALLIIFIVVGYKTTQNIKRNVYKLPIIASFVIFFLLACFVVFAFNIILWGDDHPPSTDYHPLNALIKNRCVIENTPTYCPKTAEEVLRDAPPEVKQKLQNAHITYQYDPTTRVYTLIIRNNTYMQDNNRAALFDPRLVQAKNYGRMGLDFFDVNIARNWDGSFRITNPPPFPGPWDHIN